MEPPLCSGGMPPVEIVEQPAKRLQWSRRCAAAECYVEAAGKWLLRALQWSRRCAAAEWSGSCQIYPTSGRFNGAAAVQRRNAWAPWSIVIPPKVLQWSRRCAAAECNESLGGWSALDQLQWSRRCAAAECRKRVQVMRCVRGASMGPPLCSGGMQQIINDARP